MVGAETVRQLLELNPKNLWVVDDFSSGKRENLPKDMYVMQRDLRDYRAAKEAFQRADVLVHLACSHGGRGWVANHALESYDNLGLDSTVFRAAQAAGVKKVFFMSSACAYPIALQQDDTADVKLTEDLIDYNNIQQPDLAYGVSKLAAELTLNEYGKAGSFDYAIGRGFTIFGRLVRENHAIGALIAKSFIQQNPFTVWGTGLQKRNWSFVEDIARGIILATEKLKNDVVNLGVEEYHTPNDVCEIVWDILKWRPDKIEYQLDKPVGTLNRVADASKAKELLAWEPKMSFKEGIARTLFWFMETHNVGEVKSSLERSLTER